ncbi:MAG: hypothetical protein AAGE94_10860 [Acidobacteriota bacterium]
MRPDRHHTPAPSRPLRHVIQGLMVLCVLLLLPTTASGQVFEAAIKTSISGFEECLIFGGGGHNKHPERYSWNAGAPDCGYPGGRQSLQANGQAVFDFVPIGNDEYIIRNSSNGSDECLIFGGNGNDKYPSRFVWGSGLYCGFSSLSALRANGQAFWKLHAVVGSELVTITNASRGSDECLIFGGNGSDPTPSRHNWGSGSYCGLFGGAYGIVDNGQALFWIERF